MRIRTRTRVRENTQISASDDASSELFPDANHSAGTSTRRPWAGKKIAAAVSCITLACAAVAAFGGAAQASPGAASTKSPWAASVDPADQEPTLFVGPCTASDVSFYYGDYSQGLSQESFDVTLAAHAGIACSLSDIPAITVTGPAPIPLGFGGRGATLVLRPNSPLHTTLAFSAPYTPADKLHASFLRLGFAGGTVQAAFFMVPGGQDIASGGVYITAWTTGLGGGEGDGSN